LIVRAGVVVLLLVLVRVRVAHADIAIKQVGIKVAPTNAKGEKWDGGLMGKEPDPEIAIYVDKKKLQNCDGASDTFELTCNITTRNSYAGDIALELRITDRDIASDDPIGVARVQLFADMKGRFDLAVDGKVDSAWVEVDRVAGPSIGSRVGKYIGVRTIGAVLGVLLALLLYKLYGAKLLSPPDTKHTVKADDDDEPREKIHVNFWRSPILLASAGASILGIVLANLLRDPTLPIALGAVPYVLVGFGFTAPIIDAYMQEHLGGKRLRLVIAGVAAMFAVPLYDFASDFFTGVSFLAKHLGWTFVGILLLLCLL
jgi:hypothetical protein